MNPVSLLIAVGRPWEGKPITLTNYGLFELKAVKACLIEIASNGAYEFIFVDGDLFGGHDPVIRGSLKLGPETADLHG